MLVHKKISRETFQDNLGGKEQTQILNIAIFYTYL